MVLLDGRRNQEINQLYIMGKVKAIFFNNPSNYFYVLLVGIEETDAPYDDDEIVITGNFGMIQEEESYTFYGSMVNHPRYGLQFSSERYTKAMPTNDEAVIDYLSGANFKGVGQKTAERIVDCLGLDAVEKIIDNPEILKEINGVTDKQYQTIKEKIQENEGMQRSILLLNQLGLSNQLAYRIYDIYKEKTIEKIKENPYRLAIEVEGIGFGRADALAESLEIAADAPQRIQAAILCVLSELTMSSGDTYIEGDYLLKGAVSILEKSRRFIIDPELVKENIYYLSHSSMLIEDDGRYYLPSLYASEWGISTEINRLREQSGQKMDREELLNLLQKLEKSEGITYGPSQKEAIISALCSPIFILTGGPGTGKTTVLDAIVKIFAQKNDLSLDEKDYSRDAFPIKLAAPTGRAAKRMNEMTHLPTSTIHRLLGLTADDHLTEEKNDHQLSGDLLIIDEMSMVDTWLAYQLLQAIPPGMKVILVGDKDQLPSVGPGQVLRDLIESGLIAQTELQEIYRQEDESTIISLAYHIKNGQLPNDFLQQKKDRNFFRATKEKIVPLITQIVGKALDKGYTVGDIQVLAPMYRGEAGIDELNKHLQEVFNPSAPHRKEVNYMNDAYRIGDKVLHLVNDPERNVFNGDIGLITGISKASENELKTDQLIIDFDGTEITLLRSDWNHITLAYCCSIHKAQGSEYPIVILPMVSYYSRMLKKDLLYTAVTRASQSLILCGEIQAYMQCVRSQDSERKTSLKERLLHEEPSAFKDSFKKSEETVETNHTEANQKEVAFSSVVSQNNDYILTPELVLQQKIDPLIGMNGLSPYDL